MTEARKAKIKLLKDHKKAEVDVVNPQKEEDRLEMPFLEKIKSEEIF